VVTASDSFASQHLVKSVGKNGVHKLWGGCSARYPNPVENVEDFQKKPLCPQCADAYEVAMANKPSKPFAEAFKEGVVACRSGALSRGAATALLGHVLATGALGPMENRTFVPTKGGAFEGMMANDLVKLSFDGQPTDEQACALVVEVWEAFHRWVQDPGNAGLNRPRSVPGVRTMLSKYPRPRSHSTVAPRQREKAKTLYYREPGGEWKPLAESTPAGHYEYSARDDGEAS
jgi:hypothetical protein